MKKTIFLTAVMLGIALQVGITTARAGYQEGLAAYQNGDYATALKEFRQAAEEGDARAQLSLGLMYQTGTGVARKDAEALKWYYKAADKTHNDALHESKEPKAK